MKRIKPVIFAILLFGCSPNEPYVSPNPPNTQIQNDFEKREYVDLRQETEPLESQSEVSNVVQLTGFEKLQNDRLQLINKSIDNGIIRKIETRGSLPYMSVNMWIDSTFMMLEYDIKSKIAEVVWAYYFEDEDPNHKYTHSETVILKNIFSGNTIGSYSPFNVFNPGLKMK